MGGGSCFRRKLVLGVVAMVMAAKASTKIASGEILLIPTKERQPGPKIAKQLPHLRRIQ